MRKNSWAPFKYIIVVFGFETLHTIGVAILFYAVLPNLDTLRAGMVTSGILLLPSLLSIFRSTRSSTSKKKYVTLGLDGESLAESFYSVKYGLSNIPSNIQLLIVNIYFFYKIFSLD